MEIQINHRNARGIHTNCDKDSNRHQLVCLEVSESQKSLGVYIIVDDNEKAEESYLIKKAKEYAEKI